MFKVNNKDNRLVAVKRVTALLFLSLGFWFAMVKLHKDGSDVKL